MRTKLSHFWCGLAAVILAFIAIPFHAKADNPPWPTAVLVVSLDPCAAEEGSDPATFAVVRVGPADAPLTVQYELGGTATNGDDYDLLSAEVTIPQGAYFAPVTVTPVDDYVVEGSESVVIALQQPPTWPPPYIVTWPAVAVAHIADNDRPPTNTPPVVDLVRPPNGAIFDAYDDILLVARAFDRDGRVRTVEFFDGTTSLGIVTNRPLPVLTDVLSATDDPAFELDPQLLPALDAPSDPTVLPIPGSLFRLLWQDAKPGPHVLTAVAIDNDGDGTASTPVEIKVIEPPPNPVVIVKATDPVAAEPDPTTDYLDTATFKICRRGPTNLPVRVFYRLGGTASNRVDYRELPYSVEIPAGERCTDVVVEPIDDLLVEGTESVVLALVPPVCIAIDPPPADCYEVGRAHVAHAIIRDNDTPPNRPPLVRLVHPENGDIFLAPADIKLAALARDFDGYVTQVEFFESTNSLGVVTNNPIALSANLPPFVLAWTNVPPGRYVLSAVATDNDGALTRSCPVEIKVVPHVEPPVVNVTATDPIASEPGVLTVIDPAVFSVTRTGSTNWPLAVFYQVGGTASNGVDYQEISGHVLIPAGAAAADVVVNPLDDKLVEGTETVVVRLVPSPIVSPSNVGPRWWYRIGSNYMARAFIFDNDFNHAPKVEIVHPSNGDVFRAHSDIEIDVATVDPDGYVGRMEFFANGDLIGEQQIYFFVAPPPGQPQKFSMTWTNVPAGDYALTAKATDDRGATSLSDPVRIKVVPFTDLPVVSIKAVDRVATEPNPLLDVLPDTAKFKVSRTGDLRQSLTVGYRIGGSAMNGMDYVKLSGTVTIPENASAASIVVDPLDDNLVEGTESVILALIQPPCVLSNTATADCYLVGEPRRDIAYIRDNDCPPNRPPQVAIVSPANGSIFTAPADIRLIAQAVDSDGWVETVEFFDGTNSLGVVTNNPLILDDTPMRLTDLNADVLSPVSPLPPFQLLWTNVPAGGHILRAVATDNTGNSTRSRPIEIKVLEQGHVPVVRIMAVDPIAREGTSNTATFRVHRIGPTNAPLAVFYSIHGSAQNGVDYETVAPPITFPAGNRNARLVITPIDDNVPEWIETVVVRLIEPPVGPTTYQIGKPRCAVAIILDNDCPIPPNENLADGRPHLRLAVPKGMPFRLEASTNLLDWEPVVTDIATEDGISFVDDESDEHPTRFFRIIQEFGDVEGEQ